MSFKKDFPDYQSYENDEFFYSKIPSSLNNALCGLVSRIQSKNELKIICDKVSGLIPEEPSQNWGLDYLRNDFYGFLWRLSNKKFDKYMDFLEWLISEFSQSSDEISIDDLNEILEENKIGYVLVNQGWNSYNWVLRNDVIPTSEPLIQIKDSIKDVCSQAADHLRKSLEHLQNIDDERGRKDAVRDAVSAMESVIKKLSSTDDIKNGIQYLRDNQWGNDAIVKDGISIWKKIHELYPDIRHGNPDATELSKCEALYWIERCLCYMSYLQRKQKET